LHAVTGLDPGGRKKGSHSASKESNGATFPFTTEIQEIHEYFNPLKV